jgi:hypothetical protein
MNGAAHNMFGQIFKIAREAQNDTPAPETVYAVMHPSVLARLRKVDDEFRYVMRYRDGFGLGDTPVRQDVDAPMNQILFHDRARVLRRIVLAELPANSRDAG